MIRKLVRTSAMLAGAALFFGTLPDSSDCVAQQRESGVFTFESSDDHVATPYFRDVHPGQPERTEPFDFSALLKMVGRVTKDLSPESNPDWSKGLWTGWFVYGDSNSRSVFMAVIQPPDLSQPQLYVDFNRDLILEPSELVPATDEDPELWACKLDAEFVLGPDKFEHVPCQVLIRRKPDSDACELATVGVMRGTVQIGDKEIAAMRIDRDSSGSWFDPEDRIMLDLDGDGQFHAVRERFGCQPICNLWGKRYVIASDKSGRLLGFSELNGMGTVALTLKYQNADAKVSKINGTLASSSGIRVGIDATDTPIDCPPGDYRIESLIIELQQDGVNWEFRFADMSPSTHGIHVALNEPATFELLGDLELKVSKTVLNGGNGTTLQLIPLLKTASGMYLTLSRNGRGFGWTENRLLANSIAQGKPVGTASSGFS